MDLDRLRRGLAAVRQHALHLVVISGLVLGMGGVFAESALATGTLTNLSWAVSNNQALAANVDYSFSLTTATAATIGKIQVDLATGTPGGTPTIVANYGIGAGTVSRLVNQYTYTVTSPVAIAAGTPIFIELGANTNQAAGSHTPVFSTYTSGGTIIDGTTNGPAVPMAGTNTAKTIVVAQSTTFTIDTTSFQLNMDPTLPALADQIQTVNLTVQTDANSGYSLTVSDTSAGLQCSTCLGTPSLTAVAASGTFVGFPSAPAAATGYSVTGTGATIPLGFSGSKYTGYSTTPLQIASSTTNTGASPNTIAITDQTAIDYAAPAGMYGDTITYTMVPNYS